MPPTTPLRLGIDLGGTKIAGAVLDRDGATLASYTVSTPQNDYPSTLAAIVGVVTKLESQTALGLPVGVGIPGSLSPSTGLMQNANSTCLNGQPFDRDLHTLLGRPARFANDANCFALSEATDGAGTGARTVFGVILGTGCGGGIVINGKILDGPRGIGGEWGHNPLPWATQDELAHPPCWCVRNGCIESWVSGPGIAADHAQVTGENLTPEAIAAAATTRDPHAQATLDRHANRLARSLATVVNLIDPEVIVLGGGLSSLPHLYTSLPALMAPYIFADNTQIIIRPPKHGPASGVRGAAWLWP